MQVRQIYEALLSELSKVGAPSILLEDFNYFLNKAINQYVNKRYNIYDINQQTSDDLRVLVVKETLVSTNNDFKLPNNYLHILNCICSFDVLEQYKCIKEGNVVHIPAKKLTADAYPEISKDYYNKPSKNNPYFYINGFNLSILYGTDTSIYKLKNIDINYLKEPKKVILTPEQLDIEEDTSELMEFPDYVCNEIINELVSLIMVTISDPRLQTYIPINQSIISPIQQEQKNN